MRHFHHGPSRARRCGNRSPHFSTATALSACRSPRLPLSPLAIGTALPACCYYLSPRFLLRPFPPLSASAPPAFCEADSLPCWSPQFYHATPLTSPPAVCPHPALCLAYRRRVGGCGASACSACWRSRWRCCCCRGRVVGAGSVAVCTTAGGGSGGGPPSWWNWPRRGIWRGSDGRGTGRPSTCRVGVRSRAWARFAVGIFSAIRSVVARCCQVHCMCRGEGIFWEDTYGRQKQVEKCLEGTCLPSAAELALTVREGGCALQAEVFGLTEACSLSVCTLGRGCSCLLLGPLLLLATAAFIARLVLTLARLLLCRLRTTSVSLSSASSMRSLR